MSGDETEISLGEIRVEFQHTSIQDSIRRDINVRYFEC